MTETVLSNQDKIKYLKRYVWLNKKIDRKYAEIERWRTMLGKVTAQYTSQPKGGGSIYKSSDINIVDKIVDLEAELNNEIDQLIDIRAEIEAVIAAVEDDRERLLLQYRYLDGKTFEWIAAKMNYSWRQIHRLHSRALTNLKMS